MIRGILGYYTFADNRANLRSIVYILQMSCARTLARKYKMRHAAKAFKKFGTHLQAPDSESKKARLYLPKSLPRTRT